MYSFILFSAYRKMLLKANLTVDILLPLCMARLSYTVTLLWLSSRWLLGCDNAVLERKNVYVRQWVLHMYAF